MPIDQLTPASPSIITTGNPGGISEQRENEINGLGETTRNALVGQHGEKSEYLVLGALMAAYDSGIAGAPWPKLLDFIVGAVRKSVPAYGEALCDACERVFVTNAIAQKLVPGSYKPPPKGQ